MEDISEHCSPLIEKLSRIAKSQCNSSLDQMMSSWLCFEICCALEKAAGLNTEVNIWSDISPDIKDKLGLPQTDIGIDYMDNDCTFAEQAKLYQEGGYVSAYDIDRTRLCAYRAKKHTNDKEIMKHHCEISTPEGIRLGKSKIEMDDVLHKVISKERMIYWYSLALGLKPDIMKRGDNIEPELRNCQRAAIDHIRKGRINRIRLACGSGKTRVAKEIIMKEKGQYLILVPYLTLLEQWSDYLKTFDVRIIKIGTGYSDSRGKLPKDKITIIICVYDSYKEAFEYEDESGQPYRRKFRWVIVDEAHHIECKTEGRNGEIYETIKTQKSVLLLSASLKKINKEGIELHYNYSLREAINDKICCDYDLKFCFFDVEPSMETIAKYISEHKEYSSILAYCNSIDSARKLAENCNKRGVTAKSLSCEESKKERMSVMKEFDNGEFRVLASVNTLGEGINLVNIDTCLFAEPKSSEISVTHCVGRIVRKTKGKKIAHVVVCAGYESERNPIIRIMKSLINDDELLAKISKRRKGSNRINIEHQNENIEVNEELIEKILYGKKIEAEDETIIKKIKKYSFDGSDGIVFNKSIEAHWAYMFDCFGWKWKYKNEKISKIPFFIVNVLKNTFIVQIIDNIDQVCLVNCDIILGSAARKSRHRIGFEVGSILKNGELQSDDCNIRKETDNVRGKSYWTFGGEFINYDIVEGTSWTKGDYTGDVEFREYWFDAFNTVKTRYDF